MRQLLEKRPLFAGAIVTAVALFGSIFIIRTSVGASLFISGSQAVLCQFLLGASLLTIFGWWREAGFTPISAWRHHKIFFVPILAALSPLLIQGPIVDPVWPLILIHALYNFLLFLGRGNSSFGETEIVFLVLSVDSFLVAFGYHLLQLERRDVVVFSIPSN